jgi:tetratricopeptide (TPR) repeat protein
LNDAAYFLIDAKEYARAIPFAQRAIRYASHSSVTYGYATFNLGLALLEVGRCSEALPDLKRALRLEAADQRRYIEPRIRQASRCVQRGASGPAQSASSASQTAPSQGP